MVMKCNKDIRRYKRGEGELIYVPNWADDPDMGYRASQKLSFTPEYVPSFGQTVEIKKRKTVDYGLEYGYSKTAKPSIPWEPFPLAIKQKLESQLGVILQQCACNYYLDSEGYISAHSDKSTLFNGVKTAPNLIISLSFGSVRQMALRPIRPGQEGNNRNQLVTMNDVRKEKDAIVLDLEPGSLVIFNGVLNHTWKHAIPQSENKVPSGDRISLTYRNF
jgi:alkylated DNA repair dioxygenase AlkB